MHALCILDRALADPVRDAQTREELEHAAAQALWAWHKVSEDDLAAAIFADSAVRSGAVRALCGGLPPPPGEIAESRAWTPEEARDIARVLIESAAIQVVRAENELKARENANKPS
jgi:hypothetical protein